MTESIEIKNVGPIRHIRIDLVKPMTVLIGESGSGKSVLMKTIMLMRYVFKLINIHSALKNSGISSPLNLSLEELLHDDMVNYFKPQKDAVAEVTYTVNNKYTIRIHNGQLVTDDFFDVKSEDLVFLKESWVTDMRSAIPMWINRRVGMPDTGFYFKETTEDFHKASAAVDDLPLNFLDMRMEIKTDDQKRKIFLAPNNGTYAPVELQQTSSGMQSSAPLLLLADYFARKFSFKDAIQRSIVSYLYQQDNLKNFRPDLEFSEMPKIVHMHIEEPELSLYPSAQCKLIEQLTHIMSTAADDRKMELMIATHSPYIINYLNVIIRKGETLTGNDLGVYRIYNGELQNLMMKTEAGKWIVNTRDLTEPMTNILQEYRQLNK